MFNLKVKNPLTKKEMHVMLIHGFATQFTFITGCCEKTQATVKSSIMKAILQPFIKNIYKRHVHVKTTMKDINSKK